MHELHPLCTLFPRLSGSEFDSLVQDIKAHGLRSPIVLHEGMILDGGNRYRACFEAQVQPTFTEFAGGNLVAFVLSANLHRRHMSAGQQAAIVASAQDWASAQQVGRPEQSGNVTGLTTVADRMAQSGASDKTQRMADKVARADPELARQVGYGEVSLPQAVAQIDPKPPKPQEPNETETLKAQISELEDRLTEMAETVKELMAENDSLAKMIDASDQVKEALAQAKQHREMNRVLEERIRGLQNEKNEAIKAAKMWQRRAEKAA